LPTFSGFCQQSTPNKLPNNFTLGPQPIIHTKYYFNKDAIMAVYNTLATKTGGEGLTTFMVRVTKILTVGGSGAANSIGNTMKDLKTIYY
jgi:hypothetical protein